MSSFDENLKTAEGRDWLSLQFVLEELSAAEMLRFEELLDHDFTLCESVARSAAMLSSIAAACEMSDTLLRNETAAIVPGNERDVTGRSRIVSESPLVSPMVSKSSSSSRRLFSVVSISLSAVVLFASAVAFNSDRSKSAGLNSTEFVDVFRSFDDSLLEPAALDEPIVSESEELFALLDAPEWLLTAVELEQQELDELQNDDSEVF